MTKARWLAGMVLSVSIVGAAPAKEYRLDCSSPPFPVSTQKRAIDHSCPNEGDSDATSPKGKQNLVKNNLCSRGDPTTLSFADFMSLQQQAAAMHIAFGADGLGSARVEHLPQDRTALSSGQLHVNGRPIREGDKVQIVAFMDDPHPADLGAGEDVNCHKPDAAENDIHINLVETPAPAMALKSDSAAVKEQKRAARNVALCKAIVAEMIPHFRPDLFDPRFLVPVAKRNIPVRISGQLFFDAAHRPCNGSTPRDSSVRGSLWEIHPVYSIDVCKRNALHECPAANEGVWVPINEWVTSGVVASAEFDVRTDVDLEDHEDRKGEHEGE
jgi:hypothetical protein